MYSKLGLKSMYHSFVHLAEMGLFLSTWQWREDRSIIQSEEIIRKIPMPKMENRGKYVFDIAIL